MRRRDFSAMTHPAPFMLSPHTNHKGFSLTEALVTAALFTVLTSISIPSYKRYTRRAKTAEAKTSLGQIYIAEKSFFINHQFYIPNLEVLQIAPDGVLLYNAGFAESGHKAPPSEHYLNTLNLPTKKDKSFFALCQSDFGSTGSSSGNGGSGDGGSGNENQPKSGESCAFQMMKRNEVEKFTPPDIPGEAVTTHTSFKAYAIADLIHNPPDKAKDPNGLLTDIWCINQYKQVMRVADGTNTTPTPEGERDHCP